MKYYSSNMGGIYRVTFLLLPHLHRLPRHIYQIPCTLGTPSHQTHRPALAHTHQHKTATADLQTRIPDPKHQSPVVWLSAWRRGWSAAESVDSGTHKGRARSGEDLGFNDGGHGNM